MLAIHISDDGELFVGSRETESVDPKKVAKFLTREFGGEPSQILIVQNDEVIHHWNQGEDF
jgi:hypothetical protein